MRLLPIVAICGLFALACAKGGKGDDDSVAPDTSASSVQAACLDYIDAMNGCVEQYYGDNSHDASESTCDAYEGTYDPEDADYLECMAHVYATADCSTAEDFPSGDECGAPPN